MAEVTITGTVQAVLDRVDIEGANGTFSKRDIVIRTDEQYPQDIAIQFTQDKCDLLDIYKIGERVTIAYNLRGKEGGWTDPKTNQVKYFTSVQGWRIQREQGQAQTQTTQPSLPPASAPTAAPVKKYVHTDTAFTEAQYLATPGWTHDALVTQGKGRWETASAAPAPATSQPSLPPAGAPAFNDPDLPF